QPQVVLTLYGVALGLAASAILAALLPQGSPWMWTSYSLFGGTIGFIAWFAGYLRPITFRRILERRRRNRVLHAFGTYAAMCLNGRAQASQPELLLGLCR